MRFLKSYHEILSPLPCIIQHMRSLNCWSEDITKKIVSTTEKYRNLLPALWSLAKSTTIYVGKANQLLIHKLLTCRNILWTSFKRNCIGLLLSCHNIHEKLWGFLKYPYFSTYIYIYIYIHIYIHTYTKPKRPPQAKSWRLRDLDSVQHCKIKKPTKCGSLVLHNVKQSTMNII
jgi:hypothetical protein